MAQGAKGSSKTMGQNITARMDGDTLILEINLAERLGRSKSGKSVLIATTNGAAMIPDSNGAKANINIYTVE